ncbi:MAG TPA: nucleotidyltransferase family protein [Gemmatimonadales bacterium]|nr:nucleotidyltransferase family protein [Gemmatimonadales bacterium]
MDWTPARRFCEAAGRATARTGSPALLPELLVRYGFPGLMTRLGFIERGAVDDGVLRGLKLHDTLLREHADEIARLLRDADVPHCFVKGSALAGTVYQPGDRLQTDVDVYVQPAYADRAQDLLITLGYLPLADREQAGPAALRSALALERDDGDPMTAATVELHWGVDPVDRLLPRGDRALPDRVWDAVDAHGARNVPYPPHHAAILVHHLVHSDLLHVRGVLDLAMVTQQMDAADAAEYHATCADLGVGRFGARVARLVLEDLEVGAAEAFVAATPSAVRVPRRLVLEDWLAFVATADPADDARITVSRIRRRLGALALPALPSLARDLFWPPAAFLEWRWGGPRWRARLRHYAQLARKLAPRDG